MNRQRFITASAVAALTFGIAGPKLAPTPSELEPSLSESDIVIAAEETADDAMNGDDTDSAKMGEESGTQTGDEADTDESDTKKVDQPDKDDTTGSTETEQ